MAIMVPDTTTHLSRPHHFASEEVPTYLVVPVKIRGKIMGWNWVTAQVVAAETSPLRGQPTTAEFEPRQHNHSLFSPVQSLSD
jgi:hypothetical protein